MRLSLTIEHSQIVRIDVVSAQLLNIRETLRRLDMRLRAPRSSPDELDGLLAEYHGVRG